MNHVYSFLKIFYVNFLKKILEKTVFLTSASVNKSEDDEKKTTMRR